MDLNRCCCYCTCTVVHPQTVLSLDVNNNNNNIISRDERRKEVLRERKRGDIWMTPSNGSSTFKAIDGNGNVVLCQANRTRTNENERTSSLLLLHEIISETDCVEAASPYMYKEEGNSERTATLIMEWKRRRGIFYNNDNASGVLCVGRSVRVTETGRPNTYYL